MDFRRAGMAAVLLACLPLSAGEPGPGGPWAWAPDHVRMQFAGASGWLSLGAGYGFLEGRIEPSLMYGFVPAWIGGVDIHTVSQRTAFSLLRMKPSSTLSLHPIRLGYAANVGLGRNYALVQEEKFRGYYWPSALHFWLFAGAKAHREVRGPGPIRGFAVTADIGTLHAWLDPALRNETVTLGDILSLSLAIQVHR